MGSAPLATVDARAGEVGVVAVAHREAWVSRSRDDEEEE